MQLRPLTRILTAERAAVGPDLTVLRPLPGRGLRQVGPFIFLDHFGPVQLAPGATTEVPEHPHAGFQTVTYLLQGEGRHEDSSGAVQVIKPGDVNWMTAGRGIVHEEALRGDAETGALEGFQIWVNLPAEHKYVDPYFDGLSAAELPVWEIGDGSRIRIVAGQLGEHQSPVSTYSPLFLYHLDLQAGTRLTLPVAETHELGIYLANGSLDLDGQAMEASQMAVFGAAAGAVALQATTPVQALAFGGLPLGEPMVSYGPFVMNSMAQIEGVIRAYQAGDMGTLPR